METVWRRLSARQVKLENIDTDIPPYEWDAFVPYWKEGKRPDQVNEGEYAQPSDVPLHKRDQAILSQVACGVFFAKALVIMGSPIKSFKKTEWQEEEDFFNKAIATLQTESRIVGDKTMSENLSASAKHLSSLWQMYDEKNKPFLNGSTGSRKGCDGDRHRLRLLSLETKKLYENHLYEVLAITTNVAMSLDCDPITEEDARNWLRR